MAMFYSRARRIAWNFHDPDKDGSGSSKSSDNFFHTERPRKAYTRKVQRLRRSAGYENFVRALERDGCVVVSDFTDVTTLEKANAETRPWLQKQKEQDMKLDGWVARTTNLTRIMQRSPTIREKFFADDLYQALCEVFLATETTTWQDDEKSMNTSHPLLSSAITFDMPVEVPARSLQRDDKYYHVRHEKADAYEDGRDVLLGLFVPGTDSFTEGPMSVAIGSHLWGDEKPELEVDEGNIVDVPLKKGEAMIVLGSLYYSCGECGDLDLAVAQTRLLHAMFSCAGSYRQEENPFLTYHIEEVKQFSELVQERLGFRQREPSLGWVDLKSPQYLLDR